MGNGEESCERKREEDRQEGKEDEFRSAGGRRHGQNERGGRGRIGKGMEGDKEREGGGESHRSPDSVNRVWGKGLPLLEGLQELRIAVRTHRLGIFMKKNKASG